MLCIFFKATNLRIFAISIVKQSKMFTEKTFEEKRHKNLRFTSQCRKIISNINDDLQVVSHVFNGHPLSPVILKAQKGRPQF